MPSYQGLPLGPEDPAPLLEYLRALASGRAAGAKRLLVPSPCAPGFSPPIRLPSADRRATDGWRPRGDPMTTATLPLDLAEPSSHADYLRAESWRLVLAEYARPQAHCHDVSSAP
jgi:hypothetical protein